LKLFTNSTSILSIETQFSALAPEYCKQNEGVQLPPALGGLSNLKKLEFGKSCGPGSSSVMFWMFGLLMSSCFVNYFDAAYIASGSFPTEFGGLTQLTSLRIG
jgi:hypothetical protein